MKRRFSLLLPDHFFQDLFFPMTDKGGGRKLKLIKILIKEENQFINQFSCKRWQDQAWANPKQGQGRVKVH